MKFIIFGSVFALLGLLVAALVGPGQVSRYRASENWVQVDGEIVSSGIRLDSSGSGGSAGRSTHHDIELEYRYEFEGEEFVSDRETLGFNWQGKHPLAAQARANLFPVGARVSVLVDPRDPASATLERGSAAAAWFPFLIGGVFLAAGLLFAFVGYRRVRAPGSED